ncbi:MAG TPA: hypothetical protein VEA40_03535 [Ramlibacter sp.]|nr:hypothetical protein [Ramlibacter sp.]
MALVPAQAGGHPHLIRPGGLELAPQPKGVQADAVAAHRCQPHARFGVVQSDLGNAVLARLGSIAQLDERLGAQCNRPRLLHRQPRDAAPIDLLELVELGAGVAHRGQRIGVAATRGVGEVGERSNV